MHHLQFADDIFARAHAAAHTAAAGDAHQRDVGGKVKYGVQGVVPVFGQPVLGLPYAGVIEQGAGVGLAAAGDAGGAGGGRCPVGAAKPDAALCRHDALAGAGGLLAPE